MEISRRLKKKCIDLQISGSTNLNYSNYIIFGMRVLLLQKTDIYFKIIIFFKSSGNP